MADRKPLKVLPDGGGDSAGLSEFVAADTIGVVDGGTGLATVATSNILTGNGTSALSAESNLTFDGSTLTVAGALSATGNVSFDGGSFVFNETGADKDFRIEGDSEANLFFADASTDRIGIGTATPAAPLEVFVTPGNGVRITDPSGSVNASEATLGFYGSTDGGTRLGYIGYGGTSNSLLSISNDQSDSIVMSTGGTGALYIDSSAHTGIGAASSGEQLKVTDADNTTNTAIISTHASFTGLVLQMGAVRVASSLYNFGSWGSGHAGVSGDVEFKFRGDGEAYADGSWNGSGADYQEFFESSDGSALEVGKSVVMNGDKVRVYDASSDNADNIVGVVRPKEDNKNSAVTGNTAWNHWTDKYLTDDWGVYLREDVTVWEWDDVKYIDGDELPEGKEVGDVKIEEGSCYERDELAKDSGWTPPAGATSSTQGVRKLNPEYDESKADGYKPREGRAEWNLIGLLGQVQIKANEPTRPTWIKMKQISDSVDLWLVR